MAENTKLIGEHALYEKSLVLHKLQARISYVEGIGDTIRNSLDFAVWRDHLVDRMVYQLTADVFAEKLAEERIEKTAFFRVDVHASWWQHFKDDVLDRYRLTRWFVRWRPVRFKIVESQQTLVADFKQYALFPAADIVTPESIHRGFVVVQETAAWR